MGKTFSRFVLPRLTGSKARVEEHPRRVRKTVRRRALATPRHGLQSAATSPGGEIGPELSRRRVRVDRARYTGLVQNHSIAGRKRPHVGTDDHKREAEAQAPVRALVGGGKHRVELTEAFGRPLLEFGATFEANPLYTRARKEPAL